MFNVKVKFEGNINILSASSMDLKVVEVNFKNSNKDAGKENVLNEKEIIKEPQRDVGKENSNEVIKLTTSCT